MRTYGKARLKGGEWHLALEPHAAMQLKRILGRIAKDSVGVLKIKNTDEVCRDLEWFMQRYPLDVQPIDALLLRATRHKKNAEAFSLLVAGEAQPQQFDMAVTPREYQRVAAECMLRMKSLLLGDTMGLGKQHPIDTLVLTPSGYVPIGTIHVGDMVIGSDGQPVAVTGVFPQGVKPSYRVTFSDDSSVEAGPEHLWGVDYLAGGKRWQRLTLTTDQLRERGKVEQRWTTGTRACTTLDLSKTTFHLPMLSAPVQFAASGEFAIPAYLLGQIIANGSCAHGSISITVCTKDLDSVRASIAAESIEIGSVNVYDNATRIGVPGAEHVVAMLGLAVLSPEKHIPKQYILAGVTDRVALLQGLMDGDGSCSVDGNRLTYASTSKQLALDIQHLVEQLGGIASVNSYDRTAEGKPVEYRVRLRLPAGIAPFRVPRKAVRYQPGSHAHPTRTVESVEYVRDVESVCIRVDAPDRLYATEHAILTHNTGSAICALTDPRTRPALVVTMTSLPKQWEAEINRFCPQLRTHILKTGKPYDVRIGAKKLVGGQVALVEPEFPDVIITSYSKLTGWADALAGRVRSVIYDECQELRRKGDKQKPSYKYNAAKLIASKCEYKVGLSGTPIFNYGEEFLNVISILKPGALGSREEFVREWCSRDGETGKAMIKSPKAFGAYLRDAGLMLRRTRADVGRELPPIQRTVVPVDADEKVLLDVDASAMRFAEMIVSASTKPNDRRNAFAQLDWRLRQATGLSKVPAICGLIDMLIENGERVVVFAWHRGCYDVYREKLKAHNPVFYTGEETQPQRAESKRAFLAGESRVLFISLRTAAGLDGLQYVSRTVVFAELDWSPGVHDQCECRVFRDGQPDSVSVYYPMSDSGSDPIVSEVLGIKRLQVEGVLDPKADDSIRQSSTSDGIRRLAEQYIARKSHARHASATTH